MLSKSNIAEALGLDEDDITDSVYNWAVSIFYRITGLKSAETEKTYREFVCSSKSWIKLPDSNISEVSVLKIDNVTTGFTLFTDLKFNPDTGLLNYSGGFSGGQLVEITYTVDAAVLDNIHEYLVTLLVVRSLSMFNPGLLGQVKMVKIGKYQRQFANVANNLDDFLSSVNAEIEATVGVISGDDGKMKFGSIV